jgi:prolyl oligopeptidase
MKMNPAVVALLFIALCVCLLADVSTLLAAEEEDPYLEYEKIDSPEAVSWIKLQNDKTFKRLAGGDRYRDFYSYILGQLNAKDRIVSPSFYVDSDIVRNFWRDEEHPQGIVQETTVAGFMSGNYNWQTILDLDALSREDGKTWVYGSTIYPFLCNDIGLLVLSDGGTDATEIREYNYIEKRFVKDGFTLPASKSGVNWLDVDTLLVASAFMDDDQTTSGYPRVIKLWKRNTPFSDAKTIFSGEKEDMSVGSNFLEIEPARAVTIIYRGINYYSFELYLYENGETSRILIPNDADLLGVHKGNALIRLKSDWVQQGQTFKQGSIVYFPYTDLTSENKTIGVFYEPTANNSFDNLALTYEYAYLTINENVQTKIFQYELSDNAWSRKELPVAAFSTASVTNAPEEKGFILYQESGFLSPPQLYRLDEKSLAKTLLQSLPERFAASAYEVNQYFAESADKTRVPYFIVHKKGLAADSKAPVLQYGYGGFLANLLPYYSPVIEYCWLRHGGVYVVANIRGGGEYGPSWHAQAIGVNRHKAFEDFIAVSEDLIKRGITSPGLLGIQGESNGGLLTGAVMVMRPDLYSAAIIGVPLLDMLRYHLLPPGASWIGEYGDPRDPDVALALRAYSPYQNLKKGVQYPVPLLITSSKDDRVHPGHARKFAKRLEEYGRDFYYYEDLEGGHSGDANLEQVARTTALEYLYLWERH